MENHDQSDWNNHNRRTLPVFSLENYLDRIQKLADWGQLKQFGEHELVQLPLEHYSVQIAEALTDLLKGMKVPKKKLQDNPNLIHEREAEINSWLKRFQPYFSGRVV